MGEQPQDMKAVYFAAPVRINWEKAFKLKEEFLHDAVRLLRKHKIHVESPHIKYGWINRHPEYTTTSDIEKYAREQGIHLMEEYPLEAMISLTSREEESDGMQKEAEAARERGIPVHYFPYFTTESGDIERNGVPVEELEEILAEI